MNLEPDHTDAHIARYLTGEASGEEIASLEAWKKQSDANLRYFQQFQLIFNSAASAFDKDEFDADAAWNNLRQRLPASSTAARPQARQIDFRPFLRLAAALALFLTVGIFLYRFANSPDADPIRLAAQTTVMSDTLPGGIAVFLNKRTSIEYTFDEHNNVHSAALAGEAYFNVHQGDEEAFIVRADETFIEDVGTSFNVRAYPASDSIEVLVDEGEVRFYTKANPGISLTANQRGIYNKRTKTFVIAAHKPNITAYMSKSFVFDNYPLAEVVETLNRVYETRISIPENLKGCRLTVSFDNERIDEIAQVIAETLSLTVSRSGNVIMLTGKGCEADAI